jgi:hypothetical protein
MDIISQVVDESGGIVKRVSGIGFELFHQFSESLNVMLDVVQLAN